MKRTTYALMSVAYFYAQLLGVVNFYYDCRLGKARKNVYITIYSSIVSLAMFGLVPYFALTLELKTRPAGAADLHYKLSLLVTALRMGGVLITISLNWVKRDNFIKFINNFQQFSKSFLQKWQVAEKYEKYLDDGIKEKYARALLADLIMFAGCLQVFYVICDIKNPFILIPLSAIPTVSNIIMAHYYMALLNVNILLILINDEIKRILNSLESLQTQKRFKHIHSQTLTFHCGRSADELDDLFSDLYQLHRFMKCINNMYDVQIVCYMLALYLNNICVIYSLSMISEHQLLWFENGAWNIYFIPVGLSIYYCDLYLFFRVLRDNLDLMEKPGQLLRARQLWISTLAERLEKSLKKFFLQLASFPAQNDLLGLFKFNRVTLFATACSTMSNAIVLVQYDLKYTKEI